MEDNIGFNDEEERTSSSLWQLDVTSVRSLEEDSSKLFYQHQNLQLHLLQKKETVSERRIIPTSMHERLSYYRTFISSATKTQIICMQHVQFNRFLWYYITNVIFKSLPHMFVQIFLAAYAPEEHLFLSKMVPIFQGTKWMLIIAGCFELVGYVDTGILLLDYVICGFLFQNPWNRCKAKSYNVPGINTKIYCYNLEDFAKKFNNKSVRFKDYFYIDANNESFQVAQIEYYRHRRYIWDGYITWTYFIILWLSTGIAHQLVFKKTFWKTLNILQWIINSLDFLFFIHLAITFFHEQLSDSGIVEHPFTDELGTLWKADIDMLAESTTAPPVVHVLTSRSTQEIKPTEDSAIIITSNAVCFIFRGLLTYRVKRYVENFVGASIQLTDLNQHSWFYFFPMYFSTFYLGDLYTLTFMSLNLIMEILTIIVTYHSLVEVVVCEWRWVKRYRVTIFFSILGVVIYLVTTFNVRIFFYICSKVIAALTEIIVIYCMYPLGRLIDDFTFHYGMPPTKLKILSLGIVPIFYTIKCYTMLDGLFEVMSKSGFLESIHDYKWLWLLLFVPILIGAVYTMFDYVYNQKKSWKLVFCPDINWGPKDFATRQLRKRFDSRVYVGSQAPKPLSRYMIDKAEPKAYHLDLRYDHDHRSAVVITTSTFEREKKQI